MIAGQGRVVLNQHASWAENDTKLGLDPVQNKFVFQYKIKRLFYHLIFLALINFQNTSVYYTSSRYVKNIQID
jgi:hypothetical protein